MSGKFDMKFTKKSFGLWKLIEVKDVDIHRLQIAVISSRLQVYPATVLKYLILEMQRTQENKC